MLVTVLLHKIIVMKEGGYLKKKNIEEKAENEAIISNESNKITKKNSGGERLSRFKC